MDTDGTRGHSLRVKKRRDRMEVSQGSFTLRVVNTWNALPARGVVGK